MRTRTWTIVALALIVLAGACKQSETPPPQAKAPAPPPSAAQQPPTPPAPPTPFRVVAVQLGKSIDATKKVTQPTETFAPNDTIYASVVSVGSAQTVALQARWTYQDGQLVNEGSQAIAPSGPALTEFHIAKPSGWPTGKYKVEISANGTLVASKDFAVD